MKKDADIAKIFDLAQADETPKEELLTPAIYELKKTEARKKARRKTGIKIGAFACACAAVVIIALSVLLPRFSAPPKSDGAAPLAPVSYSAQEIVLSSSVSADAKAALPSLTHRNGDPVLPESVTEYRFLGGSTAYISAKFRRLGRYGIEDVTVTAEFADGVYVDFEEFYSLLSDRFNYVSRYEGGEYVGKCAVKKDGVKFYIDIMCAQGIEFDYYRNLFSGKEL